MQLNQREVRANDSHLSIGNRGDDLTSDHGSTVDWGAARVSDSLDDEAHQLSTLQVENIGRVKSDDTESVGKNGDGGTGHDITSVHLEGLIVGSTDGNQRRPGIRVDDLSSGGRKSTHQKVPVNEVASIFRNDKGLANIVPQQVVGEFDEVKLSVLRVERAKEEGVDSHCLHGVNHEGHGEARDLRADHLSTDLAGRNVLVTFAAAIATVTSITSIATVTSLSSSWASYASGAGSTGSSSRAGGACSSSLRRRARLRAGSTRVVRRTMRFLVGVVVHCVLDTRYIIFLHDESFFF